MWYTPQAKWLGVQYALYVACSLFGVAYYYVFAQAMNLGAVAGVAGLIGFSLTDGLFRPVYGYISELVGRRRVMYSAYALNAIFQVLVLTFGMAHLGVPFAICAVISGGLSGVNFPMTAALTADYWGETNNAVNYGSIHIWRALGGSFAGGLAAFVMTGTLYGTVTQFNWTAGFIVGASLGLLAAAVVFFKCQRPTVEQMRAAVEKAAATAIPRVAVT
jgi:MFS family permease